MLNDELCRSVERERDSIRAIRTEKYRVGQLLKKTNEHAIFWDLSYIFPVYILQPCLRSPR